MKYILPLIFAMLILLPPLPARAAAVDLAQQGQLELRFTHEGIEVVLYQVAAVGADGKYTLTPGFAASGADLASINTPAIHHAQALLLARYANDNNVAAIASATASTSGLVEFGSLALGMYLIVQGSGSAQTYDFAPTLIPVPYYDGTAWNYVYTVNVEPKLEPRVLPSPSSSPATSPTPTASPGPTPTVAPRPSPSSPPPFRIGIPPVDPRYLIPDGDLIWTGEYSAYFQIDETGNQIGYWHYDFDLMRWVFEAYDLDKLTQTDVLRWPVPVLAVVGTLMIGTGIYIIRKAENVDC